MITWDEFFEALMPEADATSETFELSEAVDGLFALELEDLEDIESSDAYSTLRLFAHSGCTLGTFIVDILSEFEGKIGSGDALGAVYRIANFVDPRAFPEGMTDAEIQSKSAALYSDCLLAAHDYLRAFNERNP